MQRYTLAQFNEDFGTENACLDFIRNKRYPARIKCPKCAKESKFHRVTGRKVYECDYCGYQISPTAGTILHKSSTSLRSWFYALFIMAQTRSGVSAKQLEREIGVTYKTAWRMFTQIRKLMGEHDLVFFGDVEMDETYIGGKDKNRHANKRSGSSGRGNTGKTTVVGIAERGGKAVARVVTNTKGSTLLPMLAKHAPDPSNTTVFTDEHTGYSRVSKLGYEHQTVEHRAMQYVAGEAHTGNIDNLWSHIKRGIGGVHHSVSPAYLPLYLDSYLFRFNHRGDVAPMFETLLSRIPSTSTGGFSES